MVFGREGQNRDRTGSLCLGKVDIKIRSNKGRIFVPRLRSEQKIPPLRWNFLAGAMGFEPTVTAVTGQRIKPGYATRPSVFS